MEVPSFILIVFLLLTLEYSSGTSISGTGTKWTAFSNLLVSTNILEVVESVGNVSECLKHCLYEETCVSVFYRTTQRQCQFHDVLFLSEEDGVEDSGTEYFSLTSGSCPAGYIHVRNLNLCYRQVLEKTPYNESVADCESRGEHLIVIDSQEKQDHVQKQLLASSGTARRGYFIDGSDAEIAGVWKLHDGRNMTFSNWKDGYPSVGGNGLHLVVLKVSEDTLFWLDDPYIPLKFYFCEKDV